MTGTPQTQRSATGGAGWRAALGPASPLAELARFSVVGVGTALIDLGVYNGALALLGTRSTPALLVASTLGYISSLLTSYVGNRNFTFRDRESGSRRFLPYAAVSLSGFFIENATLYLVWQVFLAAGLAHGLVAANVARAVAAVPALAWTFLLYRAVVFVPPETAAQPSPARLRLPGRLRHLFTAQPLLPLVGLIAVGIALRLPFLLALPLSAGEWQAAHAAVIWASGFGSLPTRSGGLMSVLLGLLFRATGPSFTEPRVVAVTLAAASVAATYFLGRYLWASAFAGLVAALVVAVNGPSILASHVAVSSVAAPLIVCAAAYATVRGLDGDRPLLVVGAALWLFALAAGGWAIALLPGAALVLAGGVAAAPVPRRPRVARLAGWLAAALGAALVLVGRPVWPGHLWAATTALVRTTGDLALVPPTVQPALGAAVLAALVVVLGYGLRSRRGRIVALPLLGALVGGPFATAQAGGGAVALLPLFAVLAAGTARWAGRRLARRVPSAMYVGVGALTAAVIGFMPLLGLGDHYGHLFRADRTAAPSPQILEALGDVRTVTGRHATVLLDVRGYRAGVVGWVLSLRGYHVLFVGNAFTTGAGASLDRTMAHDFLDPVGPSTPAAYVVTSRDYRALMAFDPTAEVVAPSTSPATGGYRVGVVMPTQPPLAPLAGVVLNPGEGPTGSGTGAGTNE